LLPTVTGRAYLFGQMFIHFRLYTQEDAFADSLKSPGFSQPSKFRKGA
jgi:hypothetical protein